MSSISIATRFEEGIRKASASPQELKKGKLRSKLLMALLGYHCSDFIVGTLLSGSYKRHTASQPLKDVDVLIVVDLELYENAFERVLEACQKMQNTLNFNQCRPQGNSIGILWGDKDGPNIDVAVVRGLGKKRHGFQLASPEKGRWEWTYPVQAKEAMATANKNAGGYLKPLVKLLKWWNGNEMVKAKKSKAPFKSFHLELMCMGVHETKRWKDADNHRLRFVALLSHVFSKVGTPILPPGGTTPVSDYISTADHPWTLEEMKDCLKKAVDDASRAIYWEMQMVGAVEADWKKSENYAHVYWYNVLGTLY